MNKIILNYNFEFKQKAILLIPTAFLLFLSYGCWKALFTGKIERLHELFFIILFVVTFLGLFLFCLTFSKAGFKSNNNNLYKTVSFLNFEFYAKKINPKGKKIFSILYKNVSQRNDYLSSGGADKSYKFAIQDFILLNENHLEKESVIKLDSQKYSDELKMFLEEFGQLKFEIYSPHF
jgi:hypothetical protein